MTDNAIEDLSYPRDYELVDISEFTEENVQAALMFAADRKYSDIFIEAGDRIRAKINGYHVYMTKHVIEQTQVENISQILLNNDSSRLMRLHDSLGINDRYVVEDITDSSRQTAFRVNITRCEPHDVQSNDAYSISLRVIDEKVRTPRELGIPDEIVEHWMKMRTSGLILFIGATGTGKTTSLHALIRQTLTSPSNKRILEFSRPLEFNHFTYQDLWHYSCHISQVAVREGNTGGHLIDYDAAMAQMVRKKPDIVIISEMTELESFKASLAACNTGHIMGSTIHANDVASGFSRIFTMFPVDERDSLLHELVSAGQIFVSQRLLRATDGGLVASFEYLLFTPKIRERLYAVNTESELKATVRCILQENGTSFRCHAAELLRLGRIDQAEYDNFVGD